MRSRYRTVEADGRQTQSRRISATAELLVDSVSETLAETLRRIDVPDTD